LGGKVWLIAMHLETNAIYVCVDGRNGEAHLLIPKDLKLPVFELRIDNMDPQSTDAAEYRLLKDEMEEFAFELL
jgi:hypothetical protein